ncbi:hypothetical protein JYT36_00860, partial [Bacteroidales bacterium AH-315-N07]|nr:hypothetical protein [Bacteroidales bacterium AH-315-N07]
IDAFLNLDNSRLDTFLRKKRFPKKYNAQIIKEDVKKGSYKPRALAEYLGDANEDLFLTKIIGAEVYRSDDSGKSWKKVNSNKLKGVYNTYGYYFGEVRIDPEDADKIYITGVPLLTSKDGGKTFSRLDTFRVHVDHHALWIDPKDPDHIILGNDGGLYMSYDGGSNWNRLNNVAVGQFYTVNVDMNKPYNVYGGLQDNGVYYGSSKPVRKRPRLWRSIQGGDGMFVAIDPRNSDLVYTGMQFGHYFRIYKSKRKKKKFISPKHDIGKENYRYNWRTPLVLSPHNADILYIGAQKLLRSMDKGENWKEISHDLTTNNQPQGNVPYSTITSISESPLKFGLIWIGTDDGNVYLTKDGGNKWILVSKKLPKNRWISNVFASPHDEATVFVSLNGYRYDEFKTYIYKSTDYGKSWRSLNGNLPKDVINIVIQDRVNPELLYTGTDHGAFVSLNGGVKWEYINGLPNVAVYDMIVHPRDNELVIATHGRSMYIMDIKPLQYLKNGKKDSVIIAYKPKKVKHKKKWGEQKYSYIPAKEPFVNLLYYIGKTDPKIKKVDVVIEYNDSIEVKKLSCSGNAGFNILRWDLTIELKSNIQESDKKDKKPVYAKPGKYVIRYKYGKSEAQTILVIK